MAVSSGNRFEYGGDGGTPEIGLAALEHFYYTQDYSALATYMPLATLAATFYDEHYARDESGTVVIWPTGVLEVGMHGNLSSTTITTTIAATPLDGERRRRMIFEQKTTSVLSAAGLFFFVVVVLFASSTKM